jgi:hypothetical protein
MHRFVAGSLICLLISASTRAGILELESEFRTAYQDMIGANHTVAVADLDGKYSDALERTMLESTKAGRLEEALALKDEIQRIENKVELPQTDEGAPPILSKLRDTYRKQSAKLVTDRDKATGPLIQRFGAALAALQSDLASAGKLEEALAVKTY